MNNPWQIDAAFDVMFTDIIDVSGVRNGKKFRSSVHCCLFPVESADPFIDSDTDTNLKQLNVVIKVCDFTARCTSKPKIGDTLQTIDGMVWKVADVEQQQKWWKLIARSAS